MGLTWERFHHLPYKKEKIRSGGMQLRTSFPRTLMTDYLLFFDFDETYYPHARTRELIKQMHQLENYLFELTNRHNIKIGWVTGSDIQEIMYKMELANMNFSPHFIGCNLGTELFHINKQGILKSDSSWEKKLEKTTFSSSTVLSVLAELSHQYAIELVEQTRLKQKTYKWNYYYHITSKAKSVYDLNIIKHIAKNYGIGLNINRCNPKAGDPANAFDVDFIPLGTGKSEVVQFMTNFYNVPIEKTIAFGDSGNDIDMLKAVNRGFLLANGTKEAKSLYSNVTTLPYAKGIITTLELLTFK